MKKSFGIIFFSIILLISLTCLVGCPRINYNYSPSFQPNTQWISEDGTVLIVSNENADCYGYIEYYGRKIPVAFYTSPRSHIPIYGVYDEFVTNNPIDGWHCSKYGEKEFTADTKYVPEYKNYFLGENDTIQFRKLNESEKVDFDLSYFSDTDYVNNIHMVASALCDDIYDETDIRWHEKEYDSIIISIGLIAKDVGRIVKANLTSLSDEELSIMVFDNNDQVFDVIYNYQTNEIKTILTNKR